MPHYDEAAGELTPQEKVDALRAEIQKKSRLLRNSRHSPLSEAQPEPVVPPTPQSIPPPPHEPRFRDTLWGDTRSPAEDALDDDF